MVVLLIGTCSYSDLISPEKVGIGFLVGNMLKQMELAASGIEDYKKFVLYSGHDTTLASMCAAFEVWDGFWPPYASQYASLFKNLSLQSYGSHSTVYFLKAYSSNCTKTRNKNNCTCVG